MNLFGNPLSRRQMLKRAGCGFGYLALAGLCAESLGAEAAKAVGGGKSALEDAAAINGIMSGFHHAPRAKRVIFLFMHGGPSHVDTFDYKPMLQKHSGTDVNIDIRGVVDPTTRRRAFGSPWKFTQHGESGQWVSSLFPHVAKHVDDLCFIRGMHTDGQSHGQAILKMHTGSDNLIRPAMGAWVYYGLGSENRNLPGFITIAPGRVHGGVRNYSNAFLPASCQGTPIGYAGEPADKLAIRDLGGNKVDLASQRRQIDLIQQMNHEFAAKTGEDVVDGVIKSFELAYRMQGEVPGVIDISNESEATKKLYGIGEEATDAFGRKCLMARRFAEAGVRYIQVSTSDVWDQHSDLIKHEKNSLQVDKPIAGLLADLKARGLLEDTLVLWGGEFGRTPVMQGGNGRDHNPRGFTVWLAGGGVKGGFSYGATDEWGSEAVENKCHMHDLHATILWAMGIDHEKLTYRYAGRDFRLTDVHGQVAHDIFA